MERRDERVADANSASDYSAGTGLSLSGGAFSVNFAGSGSASTAARSDHANGVVYTRWGLSNCPAGATLVYSGFTAGSHYGHAGGGANTLCLASVPGWTSPSGTPLTYSDANNDQSMIYGTEYEMGTNAIGLGARHEYESVCAVCLQPAASVTFMYPGAATCPAGWSTEYYGYLMSTAYTQTKSDFICVDVAPTAAGSNADVNGHLLYSIEAECGALPCGTGQCVHERELTCSVCALSGRSCRARGGRSPRRPPFAFPPGREVPAFGSPPGRPLVDDGFEAGLP